MRTVRNMYRVLILALLLAVGQYAGLLHGLGHATEQLAHKHGAPVKVACDQCFACSQLSSGAPAMALIHEPQHVTDVHRADPIAAAFALISSVVFHSRAPPVLA